MPPKVTQSPDVDVPGELDAVGEDRLAADLAIVAMWLYAMIQFFAAEPRNADVLLSCRG